MADLEYVCAYIRYAMYARIQLQLGKGTDGGESKRKGEESEGVEGGRKSSMIQSIITHQLSLFLIANQMRG